MNLQKAKNFVTSKAGRQVLKLQKHSPVILFAAGVTGMVATVVLASRATLKLEETLNEVEKDRERIEGAIADHRENPEFPYTEQDYKRDLILLYLRNTTKVGKLYAPAVVCGVVSIAALTGSHFILNTRNTALTAAYATVDKAYRSFRERVVAEYGEDVARRFESEVETRTVVEQTADGKTVTRQIDVVTGKSMYARVFGEDNQNFNRNPGYNRMFLQCQQNYANDLLRARGHLFLNEVYDMLGMERSPAGQIVGWVAGKGDDYVSFGFGDFETQRFINGDEDSVWLDFNVAGPVWDLI